MDLFNDEILKTRHFIGFFGLEKLSNNKYRKESLIVYRKESCEKGLCKMNLSKETY